MILANGGYDKSSAGQAIRTGAADGIVFGQKFIANSDLPERLRLDAALNKPDPATLYFQGNKGYTDYPALAGVQLA